MHVGHPGARLIHLHISSHVPSFDDYDDFRLEPPLGKLEVQRGGNRGGRTKDRRVLPITRQSKTTGLHLGVFLFFFNPDSDEKASLKLVSLRSCRGDMSFWDDSCANGLRLQSVDIQ